MQLLAVLPLIYSSGGGGAGGAGGAGGGRRMVFVCLERERRGEKSMQGTI